MKARALLHMHTVCDGLQFYYSIARTITRLELLLFATNLYG